MSCDENFLLRKKKKREKIQVKIIIMVNNYNKTPPKERMFLYDTKLHLMVRLQF